MTVIENRVGFELSGVQKVKLNNDKKYVRIVDKSWQMIDMLYILTYS